MGVESGTSSRRGANAGACVVSLSQRRGSRSLKLHSPVDVEDDEEKKKKNCAG